MLAPETERVWNYLKQQPALAGFVLIGGTALALRIQHRRSDDLDLAYPRLRLPRARLTVLVREAALAGFEFLPDDDEAAVEEFAMAGMELHDYQQNYVVNRSTKVTFFSPDAALARSLTESAEPAVRLASLEELFKAKCLVASMRSKTRDWLDLWVLMRDHGFTGRDFTRAFVEAGVAAQRDLALNRLCSGIPQPSDEGFAHLLAAPPSLQEMKDFFIRLRDEVEIDAAREAFREQKSSS